MHKSQRLINHVALVLDGSSSMYGHAANLIAVADEQIKHLALKSEELQQETRVSVYLFNNSVECLIFDMDVMRLPSIADLYHASGMTALVDATIKSQTDLATTSQIYGDHAFLTFVLTDGMENASKTSWTKLSDYANPRSLDNKTIGFLVPDSQGVAYMKRLGVPDGNVVVWDASSADGIFDVGSTIRSATDNFMVARSHGTRATRSVFSTGVDAVNRETVRQNLQEAQGAQLFKAPEFNDHRINDLTEHLTGRPYRAGKTYYELLKTETIQGGKKILVLEKSTGKIYEGKEARHLIGLPDGSAARVKPDANPDYVVLVQSTSYNRKIGRGSLVVVMP